MFALSIFTAKPTKSTAGVGRFLLYYYYYKLYSDVDLSSLVFINSMSLKFPAVDFSINPNL